jgi:ribosomal protein L40E
MNLALRICRHCRKPVGLNDTVCRHCRKRLLRPLHFKIFLGILLTLLAVAFGALLYAVYVYALACAAVGC